MKIVNLKEIAKEKGSHGDYSAQILIRSGEFANLNSFGKVVIKPGQCAEMHSHYGNYEIFFVLQGRLKIKFGDNTEQVCEKGACIVTEANETHEITNPYDESLEMLYLSIKPSE